MKFVRIEASEFNAALEASGKHLEDLLEDGIPQATLDQLSTKGGRIATETAARIEDALGCITRGQPRTPSKPKSKPTKCIAKTASGQRCSNNARKDSLHCGCHQVRGPALEKETDPRRGATGAARHLGDSIRSEVQAQLAPLLDSMAVVLEQEMSRLLDAAATEQAGRIDGHENYIKSMEARIGAALGRRLGLIWSELAQRTESLETYVKSMDDRITELGKRFDLIGQELARLLVALKSSDGPILLRTALQAILQSNDQTGADEIRAIIELSAELRQWHVEDTAVACDWVSADGNLCDRAPVPGASVCARHLEIQNRLEEP